MSSKGLELVEVHRAEEVSNAYTSRRDWSQAVKVWSGLGEVQPDKTYEAFDPGKASSQERFSVWLPITADVTSTDRVLIRGAFYEVDGEPESWTQTRLKHIRLSVWRAVR